MTSDIRDEILSRNLYMCEYQGCTNRATEVAHRIAKTKENIKMAQRIARDMFSKDLTKEEVVKNIIDNPINCAASCRMHNDYFNTGYYTVAVMAIIQQCLEDIYGEAIISSNYR